MTVGEIVNIVGTIAYKPFWKFKVVEVHLAGFPPITKIVGTRDKLIYGEGESPVDIEEVSLYPERVINQQQLLDYIFNMIVIPIERRDCEKLFKTNYKSNVIPFRKVKREGSQRNNKRTD